MSNAYNQPMPGYQPPGKPGMPGSYAPAPTNGIGLAGFIISIVSLFLCGVPAIIGLALSMIGLAKHPRGFAIAGVVISLIALIEMLMFGMVMYSGFRLAEEAGRGFEAMVTETTMDRESNNIAKQWKAQGAVPTSDEGQKLINGTTDFNNEQIIYETDGQSFTLRSLGRDGELMTADDITIGPFSSPEEAEDYKPAIDIQENDINDFGDASGEMKKAQQEMKKAQKEMEEEMEKAIEQFD